MPLQIQQEADGVVLDVQLSGKLQKDDYKTFVPAVEQAIAQHGKVRMIVRMEDFHGWTAGAFWEDVKFDIRHFKDIERLAMVGDKKWEHGMAVFCRPFTTAKIRYFDRGELEQARVWLTAK